MLRRYLLAVKQDNDSAAWDWGKRHCWCTTIRVTRKTGGIDTIATKYGDWILHPQETLTSQAFGKLHGVKSMEVHIATCRPRRAMQTCHLESAMLDIFRTHYFEPPKYNKLRPKLKKAGLFRYKALGGI